jgi:non-heme chloroperoxidase
MASLTTDDGVRLDYLDSGTAAGRPVVLIAGFLAPATSWLYQVPALEKAGYRVIAFDRRWHGTSEKPTFGNTMQRHGQDLALLLETLDLRGAVLVGGSQGGNTIWSFLGQFGSARIAGAVIVDQTPKMINDADWPYGFYDYTPEVADTMFATAIPNPGRFGIAGKGPRRILRLVNAMRAGGGGGGAFTPEQLELLNDHAKADWREAVRASDIPVLFVAGAQSEFWPSDHAAAAAALAQQGSAVVIPKDGHAANIEQPDAFNAELLRFIRSI